MSEVRLNIMDAQAVINGKIHGSIADAVIASLSAEPEKIAELEVALGRFNKFDQSPLASFRSGENTRSWDAGLVIVDMAARVIVAESTYDSPSAEGEICYHNGNHATDLSLPYRIPDDWLIVFSLLEYESLRHPRRDERVQQLPSDIRQVLYGRQMMEFIVTEFLGQEKILEPRQHQNVPPQNDSASRQDREEILDSEEDDTLIQQMHSRWLMAPRPDLAGRTPREVILDRLSFIDFDLRSRELQWSALNECPPPLPRDSRAYLAGGVGRHEYVVYYDFMRYLLRECWIRISGDQSRKLDAQGNATTVDASSIVPTNPEDIPSGKDRIGVIVEWLLEIGNAWLNRPCKDLNGRIPAEVIESERCRIPLLISPKDVLVDDCPICQMLAEDAEEPFAQGFWHFDGSHIDSLFEFSTYLNREEWEKEQLKWQVYTEEFERQWTKDRAAADAVRNADYDDIPF